MKKCIPPTRDGCDSVAAISVMLSADVFDLTTASLVRTVDIGDSCSLQIHSLAAPSTPSTAPEQRPTAAIEPLRSACAHSYAATVSSTPLGIAPTRR